MRKLEGLADTPGLLELQKDFPRGGYFNHINGQLIRQIVLVLQDRLFELGSSVRLSIDPASAQNTKDGAPRLPVALIVRDGELKRTIGIATQETSVMIGGRLIMTARDDAVARVAGALVALVAAIENTLEPNESEKV